MHIHPNNSLLPASLGASRNDVREIQERRAAEVRRKLSSAARGLEGSEGENLRFVGRVDSSAYGSDQALADDDSFGRLLSVKA